MWGVIRRILAVIAGFVAASAVMMTVETANGRLLYPELGKRAEDVTDRQEIKAIMVSAPVGALVVVLVGWALGSVAGGFLAWEKASSSESTGAAIRAILKRSLTRG